MGVKEYCARASEEKLAKVNAAEVILAFMLVLRTDGEELRLAPSDTKAQINIDEKDGIARSFCEAVFKIARKSPWLCF
jgi:hypothetical protein